MPDRTRPPSPSATRAARAELERSDDFHRLPHAEQHALLEARAHELTTAERDEARA